MDTGTHFVMGIALGGLATIDPVVFNHPETYQSVLIATIVGSQIPDIDTVLKLRNNAIYIRNHRGITHSIPAVVLWPIIIALLLYLFYPEVNLLHVWLWTFLAVFLHVFVDIFNAYGTQALRPFSSKWVALGWINTFDPFIFGIHALGIVFWIFGSDPRVVFSTMYIVLIGYYLYRYSIRKTLVSVIKKRIPDTEQVILSPTMKFFQWRIAVITKNRFYVAYAYQSSFTIVDEFERIPLPDTPVMNTAIKDTNVAAFLSFSPVYRWEIEEGNNYIEVRFIDLRYRSKDHYPFFAVVKMDHNMNILTSYTGWIYSKEKIRKKLEILPQ
ncbi:metal-dependent hydrolase [Caldibacillus sp. 210928-DFI.2.22]|uniref:metal-dependent hydrolase n=1 Tax=unclassified Caldibacillus TaxID=2641266 RepID=UPI001D089F67|nr:MULTISPECIES: metal-dependent hydrolase [unclassified Caldibacillus]MCB7070820.1 metal-dependent hydrolase [Caldibacillus sp. 210928-DFI.2.22]MCB7073586.1 metal-dependent hydrolase [Caldibacillus sp. 210928-DFI.2.18]